jgi:hypothetical protein
VRLEEATETLYNIPAAGKKKNLLTIENIGTRKEALRVRTLYRSEQYN